MVSYKVIISKQSFFILNLRSYFQYSMSLEAIYFIFLIWYILYMDIPIVILHGWGATSRSYDKLKPLLEQKGISVFVFDLPGLGSALPPPEAWGIDNYKEFARKKIAELGIDKFILFGHSFGGRIGIKFAADYPEELAGLILCDAAGITPRPKAKITLFRLLSNSGKLVFSLPILKYLQPIVRKIEYFLAGSRDYYYLQNEIMKGVFKNVVKEDLTPFLNKIKTLTLIIWGEKDKMTPVSDAYIINQGIAGSELKILEGVGHSPHLEAPEKLAEIIEKFLKEIKN